MLLVALLFAGRKDVQILQLQQQVQELQQQLIACESDRQACEAQSAGPPTVEQSAQAAALYERAMAHLEAWEGQQASALVEQILVEYPNTRSATSARRLQPEVELIGEPAPALAQHLDFWFSGHADYDPTGLTLLVFWEAWCPHCTRELPLLDDWTEGLRAEGAMTVIGLTKVTKSSTNESVHAFIAEHAIGFPIARDRGGLHEAFNVSGIPAAAVVRDGVIAWRGHPARLNEEILRSQL